MLQGIGGQFYRWYETNRPARPPGPAGTLAAPARVGHNGRMFNGTRFSFTYGTGWSGCHGRAV
ncbi:protein of unknown function [Streptantibioticus cattleyicolor NRRL 8057 = DSM 46488]|nr:protein of unknown function [Streptantibioticus cattleyicolor NRRL 8057 = DSM 46488]